MNIPGIVLTEEQKHLKGHLLSKVQNTFAEHGIYKLEFACDNLPEEAVFLAGFQVAGIQYHRDNAQAFIRAIPICLALERDCSNEYDANAIKVIGISANECEYMIGYVPADYARRIVDSETLNDINAALNMAKISANGFTLVEISLYGKSGLRRFIEDPGVLAIDEERAVEQKKDEENHAYFNKDGAVEGGAQAAPLTDDARELENAGKYLDAIELYRNRLRKDSSSEIYDRISICYGKIKDYKSVASILEEYLRKREIEYYPCRKALLDRLDKARTKLGLPKLDENYRKRLLAKHPIEPELYPEVYKIGRRDFRLHDSGLYFYGKGCSPSLTYIHIKTPSDWETLLSIYPDFPLTSSFSQGDIRVCVAISNWDFEELLRGPKGSGSWG